MTEYLTVEDVIEIHDSIIIVPIRDRAALESAVARPTDSWDGSPLYPTVMEQAAVLLHAVAMAHAFIDGNKRTATLATITFLDLNGIDLNVDQDALADFVVEMVEEHHRPKLVTQWLLDHHVVRSA